MKRSIKLFFLKMKLKHNYKKYSRILSGYSCGSNLAEHLCPGLYTLRKKIDQLYDECQLSEKES